MCFLGPFKLLKHLSVHTEPKGSVRTELSELHWADVPERLVSLISARVQVRMATDFFYVYFSAPTVGINALFPGQAKR